MRYSCICTNCKFCSIWAGMRKHHLHTGCILEAYGFLDLQVVLTFDCMDNIFHWRTTVNLQGSTLSTQGEVEGLAGSFHVPLVSMATRQSLLKNMFCSVKCVGISELSCLPFDIIGHVSFSFTFFCWMIEILTFSMHKILVLLFFQDDVVVTSPFERWQRNIRCKPSSNSFTQRTRGDSRIQVISARC